MEELEVDSRGQVKAMGLMCLPWNGAIQLGVVGPVVVLVAQEYYIAVVAASIAQAAPLRRLLVVRPGSRRG